MTLRPNWQSDCQKCVGSKFTCDKHYLARHCLACRKDVAPDQLECCDEDTITQDELNDRAERQEQDRYEAFHGGEIATLDEQHRKAWEEKQALRSAPISEQRLREIEQNYGEER